MIVETMLQRIEAEKTKVAAEAMQTAKPGEFHYGRAVGVYEGLDRAANLLLEIFSERNKREPL